MASRQAPLLEQPEPSGFWILDSRILNSPSLVALREAPKRRRSVGVRALQTASVFSTFLSRRWTLLWSPF